MTNSTNHPDHFKETGRLNRISGQIEGIKKMIAEHRESAEILSQLRAVRSANVLKSHLQHCVVQSFTSSSEEERQQKIDELREMFNTYSE